MRHERVLLVDYGGVLGDHHQEPAESELARVLGVDVPTCRKLVSEKGDLGRAFREDRMSEEQFWQAVAERVGITGSGIPAAHVLSRLWAQTYRLKDDLMSLMASCRERSYVGILTNVDRARGAYLENELHLPEKVDIYLPSYRFRAIKPSAELWQRADDAVAEKLGRVRTYYVDDRTTHVEACRAAGWIGFLYTDVDQFREWLVAENFIASEVRR